MNKGNSLKFLKKYIKARIREFKLIGNIQAFDVTVNPEFEATSSNISGNFLPCSSEKTCLVLHPAPAWGCTDLKHTAVTRCERDFTAKFRQKQSCIRYTPVETPLNGVIKRWDLQKKICRFQQWQTGAVWWKLSLGIFCYQIRDKQVEILLISECKWLHHLMCLSLY